MSDKFVPPMAIALGAGGEVRLVRCVREAAECLMDPRWPARGQRHEKACEAILDWLDRPGNTGAEKVRKAFCHAAEEAGILLDAAVH